MKTAFNFNNKNSKGFSYIGLLLALSLMGLMLSQALPSWIQHRQREKEAELLWIGLHYQKAIQNYYEQSPGTVKTYPKELSELEQDRRFFGIKRHIRQIYRDPITGTKQWGMVKDKEGNIIGLYSLSEALPIKQSNFPIGLKHLEGARRYSQWVFGKSQ